MYQCRPLAVAGLRLYSSKAAQVKQTRDRIIRVDHAGELGADRIYAGQMAVLGEKELLLRGFSGL